MASEEDEFAIMFHEFYPSLCRFLECLLGGRGAAGVAQEIAQDSDAGRGIRDGRTENARG
jgi:hypothetical protein